MNYSKNEQNICIGFFTKAANACFSQIMDYFAALPITVLQNISESSDFD